MFAVEILVRIAPLFNLVHFQRVLNRDRVSIHSNDVTRGGDVTDPPTDGLLRSLEAALQDCIELAGLTAVAKQEPWAVRAAERLILLARLFTTEEKGGGSDKAMCRPECAA